MCRVGFLLYLQGLNGTLCGSRSWLLGKACLLPALQCFAATEAGQGSSLARPHPLLLPLPALPEDFDAQVILPPHVLHARLEFGALVHEYAAGVAAHAHW
jgi:hypothetical protein